MKEDTTNEKCQQLVNNLLINQERKLGVQNTPSGQLVMFPESEITQKKPCLEAKCFLDRLAWMQG